MAADVSVFLSATRKFLHSYPTSFARHSHSFPTRELARPSSAEIFDKSTLRRQHSRTMITRNHHLLCIVCFLAVAGAFVPNQFPQRPEASSRLFEAGRDTDDRVVRTEAKTANGKEVNGELSSHDDFGVFDFPAMVSRMATDVMRKVRWGDAVTPSKSASLYMNPATQRLATNLTVSWEPDVADMIKALARLKGNKRGRPLLLGVVGIPGSGKSTSCDILASCIGDRTLVMPMDGYHLSMEQLAQLPDPADVIYRRGAPDTFDPQSLIRDLKRIKTSKEAVVKIPVSTLSSFLRAMVLSVILG